MEGSYKMSEKYEQAELNDSTLQNVTGGTEAEGIILDAKEIAEYQKNCWDLHNHEYDAARCAACTRLGAMSKSICKDMLSYK